MQGILGDTSVLEAKAREPKDPGFTSPQGTSQPFPELPAFRDAVQSPEQANRKVLPTSPGPQFSALAAKLRYGAEQKDSTPAQPETKVSISVLWELNTPLS